MHRILKNITAGGEFGAWWLGAIILYKGVSINE
jgi:hypothetical protein